jgi:hypothetical protein
MIDQDSGMVTLQPLPDWNGDETLTFIATDGMYNTSTYIYVEVIPVNDPPKTPKIIHPSKGCMFNESEMIDLMAVCEDPDMPEDTLQFYWYSNLSGLIGMGDRIEDVRLPSGVHEIKLTVKDRFEESAKASIMITIIPDPMTGDGDKDKSNGEKDDSSNKKAVILILISAICISVFLLLLFFKKKRPKSVDQETSAQPRLPDLQPIMHQDSYYHKYNIQQEQYQEKGITNYPGMEDENCSEETGYVNEEYIVE